MKQLQTIQTENNLNDVFAIDEPGNGGAHHLYAVCRAGGGEITEDGALHMDPESHIATIQIQHGPRFEAGSTPGVCMTDLLEIVRDQLRDFQKGPFPCKESACALIDVECALLWLNARAKERAKRGVLGRIEK